MAHLFLNDVGLQSNVFSYFGFDYTKSYVDYQGRADCWLPFVSASSQRSRLLSQGLKLLISQVTKDIKSKEFEQQQAALVLARDLLRGHAGDSKILVIEELKENGMVCELAQLYLHSNDDFSIMICECLAELLWNNEEGKYIEEVTESGIIAKLVHQLSSPNELSNVIITFILVLLQTKEDLLHVLIALERADTPNVLIALLQLIYNNKQAHVLLKVLQVLLKKSHLAVRSILQSGKLEELVRWLVNTQDTPTSNHAQITFDIVIDLFKKHENLSQSTKIEALAQMHKGGIANIMSVALQYSVRQADALYALNELCCISGGTEVIAHLLEQRDYQLLVEFACNEGEIKQDVEIVNNAKGLLGNVLNSAEGYQVVRNLVLCRGVAPLILYTDLNVLLVSKVCSRGGFAILMSLSCGKPQDCVAACEALAAVAMLEPALCAPTFIHSNMLLTLMSEFLIEVRKLGNKERRSQANEMLIGIVTELFQSLPTPTQITRQRTLSKTLSSTLSDRTQSPVLLQSQPSGTSTLSSLSQISIPREEVNLKRYDSTTFIAGGQECYAMGWMLEQQSPFIQRRLSGLRDVKGERVTLPRVPGLSEKQTYDLFQLAVEFAYTKTVSNIEKEDVVSLWAFARKMEMAKLAEFCEEYVTQEMVFKDEERLMQVLCWLLESPQFAEYCGSRVWGLCVEGVAERLGEYVDSEVMQKLLNKYIEQFSLGLAGALRRRLEASMSKMEDIDKNES